VRALSTVPDSFARDVERDDPFVAGELLEGGRKSPGWAGEVVGSSGAVRSRA